MRKILLASVATLGTAGLMSGAFAQAPAAPPIVPTEGQTAWTPLAGNSTGIGANNNNNTSGTMLPGLIANPTPGTIVVHIGAYVVAEVQGTWTNVDKRIAAAPSAAANTLSTTLGANGTGPVSVNPDAIATYARLFFGADGMATNGLRYGAGIEIRQNFSGQISNNGSTGASGYTSMETLYVRRAFTYVAGDQWGIVRVGQADGLWSLYGGPTSYQFLQTGNLNGGDLQNMQGSPLTFVFSNVAGNEYANAKIVYLSPQMSGFDFGFQWAPNTSNGGGLGAANVNANGVLNGSGIGTGNTCGVVNSGCPTLTSGPGIQDGARATNQTAIGMRYQGTVGGVGVYAWAAGEFSGHATYTGSTSAATLGITGFGTNPKTGLPNSQFNGSYNGLAVGQGGLNLSYAGFTIGGEIVGGSMNGQLALQPQNGAPLVGYLLGAKYVTGPWTFGVVGETWWEQGSVTLTGLTQRVGHGIDTGFSYQVAPGFNVFAEYLWNDQKQSLNNFNSGVGQSSIYNNNTFTGQGVMLGNIVSF